MAVLRDQPFLSTVELAADAERRWALLSTARPDLDPAIELQRRLLSQTLRTLEAFAAMALQEVALLPTELAAKLDRGVPMLSREPLSIPVALLAPTLGAICETLAAGGAGDAARHVAETLASGRINAGSLLTASLARNQTAVRQTSEHLGLSPDLVWLVAELAVGPFTHLLARRLLARDGSDTSCATMLDDALDRWTEGSCAVCGSWPALAEVTAQRTLRCSFCATAWTSRPAACIYCGEFSTAFSTCRPNPEEPGRQLETCHTCGGYLKVIDTDALTPFPLMAIQDLATLDLDMVAVERGFSRPPMREIEERATGTETRRGT